MSVMRLEDLNALSSQELEATFKQVCGARDWQRELAAHKPYQSLTDLKQKARTSWSKMTEAAWLEAFKSHPRIGEKTNESSTQHQQWSRQEQSQMSEATDVTRQELAKLNEAYFKKFGFIFIICATGLSPSQMLSELKRRIEQTREAELKQAAIEQGHIIELRIEKLCPKE